MKNKYNYAAIHRRFKSIALTDFKPDFNYISVDILEDVTVINTDAINDKLSVLCISGSLMDYTFIMDNNYDISEYDETSFKYRWFTRKPYLYGWSLKKKRISYDFKLFNISTVESSDNGNVVITWR